MTRRLVLNYRQLPMPDQGTWMYYEDRGIIFLQVMILPELTGEWQGRTTVKELFK